MKPGLLSIFLAFLPVISLNLLFDNDWNTTWHVIGRLGMGIWFGLISVPIANKVLEK